MSTLAGSLALSLSNLAFFLPFVEAIRKWRWTRAYIYFLLVFASGLYHLCFASALDAVCLFDHNTHQQLDFFLSYLLIPLSALYFVDFTQKWSFLERWLIMTFALVIFLIHPTTQHIEYILLGVSLFIVFFYWIVYFLKNNHFPPYQWGYVFGGLLFVLGSFAFFIWQDHIGYDVSHTIWHLLAAIGQFLILRIRKTDERARYSVLDTRILLARPIPRIV